MSDSKIIDLDPRKRLTKEALAASQASLAGLTVDNTESLMVFYVDKEGTLALEAFGIDWAILGIAQAHLEDLRNRLLYPEEEND